MPSFYIYHYGAFKDLLIIFQRAPKIIVDRQQRLDDEYIKGLNNSHGNILAMDSIYRYMLIKGISQEMTVKLERLFYNCHYKKVVPVESPFRLLGKEDFLNLISTVDISDRFSLYIKQSENIKNSYLQDFSLYTQQVEYTGVSENGQLTTDESYIRMKIVSVGPSFIHITHGQFTQTSRFLRKYYKNDNFIKVDFIDESYKKLFTNKFNTQELAEIYNIVCTKGISIANRHYSLFFATTNNIRNNSMWFIDEEYLRREGITKQDIYKDLGIESLLNNGEFVSKVVARLSLNFSGTVAYTVGSINYVTIDDIEIGGYIFNDGCGKVSLKLLKDICSRLNKDEFASAIQIRYKGAKGVIVANNELVDNDIHLTKSMVKFECHNSDELEICRFADYSPGFLNLQIIILLIANGVRPNVIFKFARKTINSIYNTSLVDFRRTMAKIKSMKINEENHFLTTHAVNTYIYNRLSVLSKKYKIPIKKSAFLMGVIDYYGLLNENEVYVQLNVDGKRKVLQGDILITKNPCLSLFDLQKATAVSLSHPFYKDYLYNVIVFPAKGTIPLTYKISNSDLDGDIYWLCWEPNLVKSVKPRDFALKHRYRQVSSSKFIPIERITIDNFDKTLCSFFNYFQKNYKLDRVNNLINSHANNLLRLYYGEANYKREESINHIEYLANIHCVEVDACKNGNSSHINTLSGLNIKTPDFLKKNNFIEKVDYFFILKKRLLEYKYEHGDYDVNYEEALKELGIKTTEKYRNKYLKDFEKNQYGDLDWEFNYRQYIRKSALYVIYKMISFETHQHDIFYNLIYLSSEKYYYDKVHLKRNVTIDLHGVGRSVILDIRDKLIAFNQEIKTIMIANNFINEIDVVYMIFLKIPYKDISTKDTVEWQNAINHRIKVLFDNFVNSLSHINKEIVKEVLFILIYQLKGQPIIVNNRAEYFFDEFLSPDCYPIKDINQFLKEMMGLQNTELMRNFYYERIKLVSLIDLYKSNN
jgi:hypothetical protein